MKNFLLTKIIIGICLLLLFVLALSGGTIYWAVDKLKNIADSALNVSRGSVDAPPESSPQIISAMPAGAAKGQDLPEAPPYANAIRSRFYLSNDKNFISVEYFAESTADDIFKFYKNYLEARDWVLSTADLKTAIFLKEGNYLSLNIIAQNTSKPITQYSLNLTKYSK